MTEIANRSERSPGLMQAPRDEGRRPRLSFSGVSHRYGRVTAVEDLTLMIGQGEVLALLGRSGCGKTTLLRVAAGIERQTSGAIHLDGRLLADQTTFTPPEKRGIGLVFQDYALFPHLQIEQNVAFGLKGLGGTEARKTALAAIDRVGLAAHAKSYPHALSGGEQQRVALARALAPRPSVLLMDEPFSGLDRRLRDDVRDDTLRIMRETGTTCLMVTHDPDEAMRMADRIALMHSGQLIEVATPEQLYRQPRSLFAARFFSELNEMAAIAREGRVETPLGDFPSPVRDGPVVVALRVPALQVAQSGEGVAGRVLTRRFLGETSLLEIEVEGLQVPIRAMARSAMPVEPQDMVGVITDPSAVLVFRPGET